MYEHFKEAALPLTYRRKEIACIIASLAVQRSIRVAGLSGMGKSNLLRFLVSHPQLLENEPALPAIPACLLYLDCNRLNPVSPLSFYRECNFLLQADLLASLPPDEHLTFKQLETALRKLAQQIGVILVIDRIEHLYEKVGSEFFSQLRNLRDEARAGRMSFVFASRRPVGHLYELEKLFSDTCWVGPLAEADRPAFFGRQAERLNLNIDEGLQQLVWQLSGGHPGLLKNSLDWLKRQGPKNISGDKASLIEALLSYEPIQRYCYQLWEDLTQTEQNFLANLDSFSQEEKVIEFLKQSGLLRKKEDRFSIFSPLWQAYLKQNIWPSQASEPLQIELDPTTRRVRLQWRGKTAETVITRRLVFELLRALSATPGRIYSKDELIRALYQEEQALEVMDDALFQLVTALRKSLDGLIKELYPAMSRSCIENVRGVGYRLIVDFPT